MPILPGSPYPSWQGWGRFHGDGVTQRGGQCQATPSSPLGTSQLPPDKPRWDPIMSSVCVHILSSETLTGLAQGDHGRVPTHQGTRKTEAEGGHQHPRVGQWTLVGPPCLWQFLKGLRRRQGTGTQPQPGFKTGACRSIKQPPYPMPSPRSQVRFQGALSPKTGLGPPLGATEHGLAVPRH